MKKIENFFWKIRWQKKWKIYRGYNHYIGLAYWRFGPIEVLRLNYIPENIKDTQKDGTVKSKNLFPA